MRQVVVFDVVDQFCYIENEQGKGEVICYLYVVSYDVQVQFCCKQNVVQQVLFLESYEQFYCYDGEIRNRFDFGFVACFEEDEVVGGQAKGDSIDYCQLGVSV